MIAEGVETKEQADFLKENGLYVYARATIIINLCLLKNLLNCLKIQPDSDRIFVGVF